MSIGFVFWLLMLLWLLFGIFGRGPFPGDRYWYGNSVFAFVLFFLLGWQVFGFMIKGP